MPGVGKKHPVKGFLFAVLFIYAGTAASYEEIYSGKVVAVSDGDTILLLRANNPPFKVRLANIDAPEKAQEYGLASQQSLAELVLRKQVQVATRAVDSYGRVVAVISHAGRNINQEQVARGMAWAYARSQDKDMLAAQKKAQQAKLGLWAQADPLHPRAWRDLHMVRPQPIAQSYACGSKHHCRQMDSCAEAKFYLTNCSVKTMDGDQDGVPCESLCLPEKSMSE